MLIGCPVEPDLGRGIFSFQCKRCHLVRLSYLMVAQLRYGRNANYRESRG